MLTSMLCSITAYLLVIFGFLPSLTLAAPHNLRPGPVRPPYGIPELPSRAHNPSDTSPPVWVSQASRIKKVEQHLDTPTDHSPSKYPVFSLNSEDLHHSVTGFSSKHSCTTKTRKLFHINGVPRAIRGDDVDALYPKGFASWVGQDPYQEAGWTGSQYLEKEKENQPNSRWQNISSTPAEVMPKAGIPGYTMNNQPQNIGFTSECISVSSNGLSLVALLLSTARPHADHEMFNRLPSKHVPAHYDPRMPYDHLLAYTASDFPPNTNHIPATQAALWMDEGCKGTPDHLSHTPNPSGVEGVRGVGVLKGKAGSKGGLNAWAEYCVVIPKQDLGLGQGQLGRLGKRRGWRSMRVWYGSQELPAEMFSTTSQSVDMGDAENTKQDVAKKEDKSGIEDKVRERMQKLPPAPGKKWKGKKKGGNADFSS